MNYLNKTLEYYSEWLGKENILFNAFDKVQYVYSSSRNEPQYGYGQAFDLYIFIKDDKIIVSYGDKAKGKIAEVKKYLNINMSANDVRLLISEIYGKGSAYNIKYVFDNERIVDKRAVTLNKEHYSKYEDFFKKCNPDCNSIDWLEEYFNEMAVENLCVGVFDGEVLASCTDAPSMPYMEQEVQEIGINTLPEYRGKGYATSACRKCVCEILKNKKVPQWSTSVDNIASQKLANRCGFIKLADVITLTL